MNEVSFQVETFLKGEPTEYIKPIQVPIAAIGICVEEAIKFCQKKFEVDEIKITLKF